MNLTCWLCQRLGAVVLATLLYTWCGRGLDTFTAHCACGSVWFTCAVVCLLNSTDSGCHSCGGSRDAWRDLAGWFAARRADQTLPGLLRYALASHTASTAACVPPRCSIWQNYALAAGSIPLHRTITTRVAAFPLRQHHLFVVCRISRLHDSLLVSLPFFTDG